MVQQPGERSWKTMQRYLNICKENDFEKTSPETKKDCVQRKEYVNNLVMTGNRRLLDFL